MQYLKALMALEIIVKRVTYLICRLDGLIELVKAPINS